jgi:hypothetical protein
VHVCVSQQLCDFVLTTSHIRSQFGCLGVCAGCTLFVQDVHPVNETRIHPPTQTWRVYRHHITPHHTTPHHTTPHHTTPHHTTSHHTTPQHITKHTTAHPSTAHPHLQVLLKRVVLNLLSNILACWRGRGGRHTHTQTQGCSGM